MSEPDINGLCGYLPVHLLSVSLENWRGDYDKLCIETERGPIQCRLYRAPSAVAAVIIVAGNGGHFYSPAHDLYQRLATAFQEASISALQLVFRKAEKLEEAVHDIRAAISFLHNDEAVDHIGLVGHSFGGAAVINAAVMENDVEVLVTLCSESTGVAAVSGLTKPLLLIHGKQDTVVPDVNSRSIYQRTIGPKQIFLVEADHDLNNNENEVFERTFSWITSNLSSARPS
jgi:alpha/beta superfamily hydrolase